MNHYPITIGAIDFKFDRLEDITAQEVFMQLDCDMSLAIQLPTTLREHDLWYLTHAGWKAEVAKEGTVLGYYEYLARALRHESLFALEDNPA